MFHMRHSVQQQGMSHPHMLRGCTTTTHLQLSPPTPCISVLAHQPTPFPCPLHYQPPPPQTTTTPHNPPSAEVEVPVPLEVCWALWEDRERIPQWMPWIKSVTVQQEDPKLSRWLLSTHQFGRWGLVGWVGGWVSWGIMQLLSTHHSVRCARVGEGSQGPGDSGRRSPCSKATADAF